MRTLFIAALALITVSGCTKDKIEKNAFDCDCVFVDKQTQEQRTFVYVPVDRAFQRFEACTKIPLPEEVTAIYDRQCP